MRDIVRTMLFFSAFSPALLTLAYVRYDIHGWGSDVWQIGVVGIFGTLLTFAIASLIKSQGELFKIQIKKVEPNDFMLFAFIASYFLPLLLKGGDVSAGTIFVVMVVVFFVLWLTSSLPAHPVLRMMRFRFYKVESSNGIVYTLISKRDILDPKDVGSVRKISQSMLMEEL